MTKRIQFGIAVVFAVLISPSIVKAEILGGVPNLEPKVWTADIRTGGETSTFSADSNSTDNNLFSQQNFFIDLSFNIKPFAEYVVDREDTNYQYLVLEDDEIQIIPELRFGKDNVRTESSGANGIKMDEYFKDASVIEGGLSFLYNVRNEDHPIDAFFKVSPSFFYTVDQKTEKKFLPDVYLGAGLIDTDQRDMFYGSSFEIGTGYTARFERRFRYIRSKLEITNLTLPAQPFISIRADIGDGPDDLKVFYGVRIPIDKVFSMLKSPFELKDM